MREPVDARYVPIRGESVFTVELDGDAVLLDEAIDRLHLLNHTGALLWQLYDGKASLGELADEVAAELELDRDEVLVDILEITEQFAAEGLLG